MKQIYCSLPILLLPMLVFAKTERIPMFTGKISPIPQEIIVKMQGSTWHQGCPVALKHLAYVQLSYWGFDHQPHLGTLIVHHELAPEVVAIFHALYQHQFPIHSMKLMDEFKGNDEASMEANNTSAFNCREVTGRPGEYSQHSYGRAIDINPLLNPYVKGKTIIPTQATPFADRSSPQPGKIIPHDVVYQEFHKQGWDWGGNWFDVQDYQHFEKRAHGEKRNPYGYAR